MRFRDFDFSDKDYEIVFNIIQNVLPSHNQTIEKMKDVDANSPQDKFDWKRQIAEVDGIPVGYGIYFKRHYNDVENQYQISFHTLPEYRNRGVASKYYNHLLDYLTNHKQANSILAETRKSNKQSISFLENRGFNRQHGYVRSQIDLKNVDVEKYNSLKLKYDKLGIVITALSDLVEADPDCVEKLMELEWVLLNDEPHIEPPKKKTREDFVDYYMTHSNYLPQAWFIALENTRYIGWSALLDHPTDPKSMNNGITVIARDYRRRGLATYMKLHGFKYALSIGKEIIETGNAIGNPMLDINKSLGFEEVYTTLEFKKQII